MLRQTVPGISRIGVLRDADDPTTATRLTDYETAATAIGVQLQSLEVRGPNPDLDAALQTAAGRASGLITITNTVLFGYRKRIAELAIKYHLPTMYRGPDWVEAGGLMFYAADDLEA